MPGREKGSLRVEQKRGYTCRFTTVSTLRSCCVTLYLVIQGLEIFGYKRSARKSSIDSQLLVTHCLWFLLKVKTLGTLVL